MHPLRTFFGYELAIYFSLMLVPAALCSQDLPTGISQIDQAYHQIGFNIIAHETLELGPTGLTLPQTYYAGNRYLIGVFQYEENSDPINLSLRSDDGTIWREGINQLEINRSYDFPSVNYKLQVAGPDDGEIRKIILVIGYRSVSNTGTDYTQNQALKAFNTLNGLEEIAQWREKTVQAYEKEMQRRLHAEGYSILRTEILTSTSKTREIDIEMLHGNKYAVMVFSPPQVMVPFQLVRPGGVSESIFGSMPADTEESVISEAVGQTFIDRKSTILSKQHYLVRPQKLKKLQTDEIIIILAYRSRDNEEGTAADNLPESHYMD